MVTEAAVRWEALLTNLRTERSAREILFDPLVEDWAFAGLSEEYEEAVRSKQHSDQERAILLDRLRWIVQKRLAGRSQEIMLLYLAGCAQNDIADSLRLSKSAVRRTLIQAGETLKGIVGMTDRMTEGCQFGGKQVRILPLDSPEGLCEFTRFVAEHRVEQVALGTFADLREALVIFRD